MLFDSLLICLVDFMKRCSCSNGQSSQGRDMKKRVVRLSFLLFSYVSLRTTLTRLFGGGVNLWQEKRSNVLSTFFIVRPRHALTYP